MDINWFGFILAILIPTIVGFIYYSKMLFGNAWMHSVGLTEDKMKEVKPFKLLGLSLIMSAVLAFFLLNFNNGPGQDVPEYDTFKHGAAHGLILSLFLLVPVMVTNGLYEQKKWKAMLITSVYWIITLVLMGGALDHFHHWEY